MFLAMKDVSCTKNDVPDIVFFCVSEVTLCVGEAAIVFSFISIIFDPRLYDWYILIYSNTYLILGWQTTSVG
jgi:hypothetical protein